MKQGFYVANRNGVVPAFDVPISHTLQMIGTFPDGRPRWGNKPYAIVNRDFGYLDARGVWHWALDGMPSDGISMPRILWRVYGHPFGTYFMPAVIHDEGCYYANSLPAGPQRDAARAMIDDLFGEMCLFVTPDRPKTAASFAQGVRIGAWSSRRADPQSYYATDLAEVYDQMKLRHMLYPVLERMDVSPDGQALREQRMLAGRAAIQRAA